MTEIIELGTISSRGQIAIPSSIRSKLSLKEGSKVLFLSDGDSVILKRVSSASFAELAKPFQDMPKKIKESEVNDLIHKLRKG